MAFTEILLLIAGALGIVYLWFKHSHTYWQRKGVPYIAPTPIIGNTKVMFTLKNAFGLHLSDLYMDSRMQKESVVGIYTLNKPALIIRDLDLIKSVLIKDFYKFSNRYSTCDPHGDALGFNNLFFVKNPQWKEIRTKLTPVYTSGKIKQMYPLMLEIAQELEAHLAKNTSTNGRFIAEIKEICALFTTDLIATIAFGVRANSLQNPNADFRRQGRAIFDFTISRAKDFFIAFFLPKLVTILRIKMFSEEVSKFLRNTITHVMSERERSGTIRNDLIDVLVTLKKEAALIEDKNYYTKNNDFLVAQAGVFFTAGFETSSSTMTFAFYELAKHPELQERLRAEINEALIAENGKLSYETINSLEYLGMVVDEVLRMYPVLPFLDREYSSNHDAHKFTIEPYGHELANGTAIFIPIYGIQRDPKYWPNPNHFDPERFAPDRKKNINPMTYLPFGNGPHNCIGSRLGLLQTKVGIVHILKNHSIRKCDKTRAEMKFDPKAFLLSCDGGVHLEVVNDRLYDNNKVA